MKNQRLINLLLALFVSVTIFAQLNPQNVSIPMRDGKNLAGHLYLPSATGNFPTILIMTPYNKGFYQIAGLPFGIDLDITQSNYAIMVVDWRCFFGSIPACSLNGNNGEDGYDVVEWIATQSWSDGQVGMWGPSALGGIQFATASEQPPSLKCCVPEVASMTTKFENFYPGGVIEAGQFKFLNSYFGAYDLVIQNPVKNALWQFTENVTFYPQDIAVPLLLVNGWYDHNVKENIQLFDSLLVLSDASIKSEHKLLIGPWAHGGGQGQADLGSLNQGELSFPAAEDWNEIEALKFFDHHMRSMPLNMPRVQYYQINQGNWKAANNYPDEDTSQFSSSRWYLQPDGSLKETKPGVSTGSFTFSYDPTDPSPSIGGKTLGFNVKQGPYDQVDSVEMRNDHAIFTSDVNEDLSILSDINATLYVSSDRKDTDFCIRLTEVKPDGRSVLIGHGIQRMRYRDGYAANDTSVMLPGNIYKIEIDMDDINILIPSNSELRLIVTSSNYPLYNRNMNTGGQQYPNLNPDTLVNPVVANNTVYCNADYPSNIYFKTQQLLVGIEETGEIRNSISISPNPTSGWVSVRSTFTGDFTVYTSTGEEIMKGFKSGINHFLDLSTYPPGMYLLKFQGSDLGIEQILIQR